MTTEYQEFVLAAHEAGLDVGTSSHGDILHAVDFDTDSVRAKAKGEPDQLACGKSSDAERVDDGEERKICGNCQVELGVKKKHAMADGGTDESEDERLFLAGQGHSDGGHYSMEIFRNLEDAKEYVESLSSLPDDREWELHPNLSMEKGGGDLYLEDETLYYGFEHDWKGFVKEKRVREADDEKNGGGGE